MSNSGNWVSHTPDDKPKTEPETEAESEFAVESGYIPPSPPNAFEKFFLPIAETEDTSSFALAARHIQRSYSTDTNTTNISNNGPRKLISPRSITSESARTDDFASAAEELSVATDFDDLSVEESQSKDLLFNDILGKQAIIEETPETSFEMTSIASETTETVVELTPTPVETVPDTTTAETGPNFDVVENVYEGAKSAWTFGKGIFVFKPFMGVAEDVAVKVLSITAGVTSLEDADKGIKSTLSGVDKEFIDPAVLKLWSVLEPIIGKGDDVLKTVLGFVSKDTPMIEAEAEVTEETVTETEDSLPEPKKESEEAIAPETSTPAVTV